MPAIAPAPPQPSMKSPVSIALNRPIVAPKSVSTPRRELSDVTRRTSIASRRRVPRRRVPTTNPATEAIPIDRRMALISVHHARSRGDRGGMSVTSLEPAGPAEADHEAGRDRGLEDDPEDEEHPGSAHVLDHPAE